MFILSFPGKLSNAALDIHGKTQDVGNICACMCLSVVGGDGVRNGYLSV